MYSLMLIKIIVCYLVLFNLLRNYFQTAEFLFARALEAAPSKSPQQLPVSEYKVGL